MIDACIAGLLRYAEDTGLIEADDRLWARNRLLEALQLDGCDPDCARRSCRWQTCSAN